MQFPYDGSRQIVIPQPLTLVTTNAHAVNPASPIEFRVPTPDSRLQVKISVLFAPDPPVTFPFNISNQSATLYMYEEDEAYGGVFNGFVPLVAVAGDSGTPLALPLKPDLMGYSREFVTAADAVHGWLNIATGEVAAPAGSWVLQTRFQPYAQRIPDNEWEEIRRLCNPNLITPALVA